MTQHKQQTNPLIYPLTIAHTWNGHALEPRQHVKLELEWRYNGLMLDLLAPYYADPAPDAPAGPTDGLWDYEVVEVFLANGENYTEIELGPHGHYLVLCLNGYRQCVSKLHAIRYKHYHAPGLWMATALVPWELIPAGPWTFNAYAIHGQHEQRQYLAHFPVTGSQPDFHRLDCFQPLDVAPVFHKP